MNERGSQAGDTGAANVGRPGSGRPTIDDRLRFSLPVLGLVAMIVAAPLLTGRVLAGQDIVNYLIHAQQTAENLRQGVVWPSWSGGYYSGFGSPVLLFFPPVTSYAGALAVLVGLPVILGVGWLAVLAHLGSGMAVFGWLRSVGHRRSALPAAIVYMIAPYRWIDLYLRSALGEHWAFLWPPLILWIGSSSRLRPIHRVVLTALAVAGLLLTNLPLAVLFGLGLAVWFIVSRDINGHRRPIAFGAMLGFGLAAFSLIPVALSSSLLDLEACFGSTVEAFRPSSNTLFVAGFSGDGLNYVFSWSLVATTGMVIAGWAMLGRDQRRSRSTRWLMVGAAICLLGTTGVAGPVWDATPVLSKLQFPWRVASLATLLAAVMAARLRPARAWIVVGLAGLLAFPFSSWDRTGPTETFMTDRPTGETAPGTVFPDPWTSWEAGSGGWYWRHNHLAELCLLPAAMPRSMLRELAGAAQADYRDIRDQPAVVLENPTLDIRVLEWLQQTRSIEVDSPVAGTLKWRVLWFPEMRVAIDGRPSAYRVEETTGLVVLDLPAGTHRIDLEWVAFPALAKARLATLVSLGLVIALAVLAVIRRNPQIE